MLLHLCFLLLAYMDLLVSLLLLCIETQEHTGDGNLCWAREYFEF